MSKLSKKIVAIFLAMLMVTTTLPLSVFAAHSSQSAIEDLESTVVSYKAMMGTKVYTNMSNAYQAYRNAVKVHDKAVYGRDEVATGNDSYDFATLTDGNHASDLASAIATIKGADQYLAYRVSQMSEYTAYSGSFRPNSSTKGFSADTGNDASKASAYSTAYQNLIWCGTNWSNSICDFTNYNISSGNDSKLKVAFYVPNAVVLYTGGNFEARVGAMFQYWATDTKKRKVSAARIEGPANITYASGNSSTTITPTNTSANMAKYGYLTFGNYWTQAQADKNDDGGFAKERYKNQDLVANLINISGSTRDKIAGSYGGTYAQGARMVNKTGISQWTGENDLWVANYLRFVIPENETLLTGNTRNYYIELKNMPLYSLSGASSSNDNPCDESDAGSGTGANKVYVVNYKALIDDLNSNLSKITIKQSANDNVNHYLENGLSAILAAYDAATSYNPTSCSSYADGADIADDIKDLCDDLNNTTVTADQCHYGELAYVMKAAMEVSESSIGRWYNVNYYTGSYTDDSVNAFVKYFTYAQYIFDNNSDFAATYNYANATQRTVGQGTEQAPTTTVAIPADSNLSVATVYSKLNSDETKLNVSARADVTTLQLYIDVLEDALDNQGVFGLGTHAEEIREDIENIKYTVWGTKRVTMDLGEGEQVYSVPNYPDEALLPKESQYNTKVKPHENTLKAHIEALTVSRTARVVYNAKGDVNSLNKMIEDMQDSSKYNETDYLNSEILGNAVDYVNDHFKTALIPNAQTEITRNIVLDKVQEYKDAIQYCQNAIDNLELAFMAIPNGTSIASGDVQELQPEGRENDDKSKWKVLFRSETSHVVFRNSREAAQLPAGNGSVLFYEGDTTMWGSDQEEPAVLDSIMLNAPSNKSTGKVTSNGGTFTLSDPGDVSFSAKGVSVDDYQGSTTISTTNNKGYGAATYGIKNLYGVAAGKTIETEDGYAYVFGKTTEDGTVTSSSVDFTTSLGRTVGDDPCSDGVSSYCNSTTQVTGQMYLAVPAEAAVTLTASTLPQLVTYTTPSSYFGAVYYFTAETTGFSVAGVNIGQFWKGYYFERTSSAYSRTVNVVDYTTLKELIATVNALRPNNFTQSSWNAMKAALVAANSNDFGNGKSYDEVSTSALVDELQTRYTNLYTAWKNLVPASTNAELIRTSAQATGGKLIGAVLADTDNAMYNMYQTANDVDASNPYGTYTTNTWNAFANAYSTAADTVYGNNAIYATPTYTASGEPEVIGARAYARYIDDADGNALTLGDLEAKGIDISNIDGLEANNGISLSETQSAINTLANNVRTTYAALKQWADFSAVDSAMATLTSKLTNADNTYLASDLQAINTGFAALATDYYKVANDAAAQHALKNGVAVYTADDTAAIASEAAAIRALYPTAVSLNNIDTYTAEAVIALAEARVSDPDAQDASLAIEEAKAIINQIQTTVKINPLSTDSNDWNVIGVNYADNATLDQAIQAVLEDIQPRMYTVTVVDTQGNVLESYEDERTEQNQSAALDKRKEYGTAMTINSTVGSVSWKYNFESYTTKNHTEINVPATESFDFVVLGDTTIVRGDAVESAGVASHKIVFKDNLNHVFAVEYLNAGDSISFSGSTAVLNIGGTVKEIAAPDYPFYNFSSYDKTDAYDVTAESPDTIVYTANYTAQTSSESEYTLQVMFASSPSGESEAATPDQVFSFGVNFNDMVTFDPWKLCKPSKRTSGFITINGVDTVATYYDEDDEEWYEDSDFGFTYVKGRTEAPAIYAYTIVEGATNIANWSNKSTGRLSEEGTSAIDTEILSNLGSEYTLNVGADAIIIIYETADDYNYYCNTSKFIGTGNVVTIKESLVHTNTKVLMNGNFYLDGTTTVDDIIECGILAHIGEDTIESDALKINTFENTPNTFRFKYAKSKKYGNINVSINRGNLTGRKITYRSYIIYKATEGGKTVYKTVYSDKLATDTI